MFKFLSDVCDFIFDNFIQVILILIALCFLSCMVYAIVYLIRETPEEKQVRLEEYKLKKEKERLETLNFIRSSSGSSYTYNYNNPSTERSKSSLQRLNESRPGQDEVVRYGAVRKDSYGNIYNAANERIDKAAVEIRRQTQQMKQMEQNRLYRENKQRNCDKVWGKK